MVDPCQVPEAIVPTPVMLLRFPVVIAVPVFDTVKVFPFPETVNPDVAVARVNPLTEVGVMAPKVSVMFPEVVIVWLPEIPLAVAIPTLVTVPEFPDAQVSCPLLLLYKYPAPVVEVTAIAVPEVEVKYGMPPVAIPVVLPKAES